MKLFGLKTYLTSAKMALLAQHMLLKTVLQSKSRQRPQTAHPRRFRQRPGSGGGLLQSCDEGVKTSPARVVIKRDFRKIWVSALCFAVYISITTGLLILANHAQAPPSVQATAGEAADKSISAISAEGNALRTIKAFFQPPAEFADQLGLYRSPLIFNDGSTVKESANWVRRRAEIYREWNELMGEWPPVIEKPEMGILSEMRRENFTQRRVRIQIAPGQTGEGWLLLPEARGSLPAVLIVYYEPETSVGLNPKQSQRDFGLQLARRGFITLSIGTPGGNAWKPQIGAAVCQPLSFHAYVAANCWHALANLPQVDRKRIGVVGHSYGGKWAMFAAALWEKFACVAVSDPGIVFDESRSNVNYWEPWYLGLDPERTRKPGIPNAGNPRTGAYRKMIERGRDLHELHALIAPRPFLVSGGAEDPPLRWIPLNHALAVNQLLGFTNRVAMTSRKLHDPNESSNAQLYDFFEYFLKCNAPEPQ